MKKLPFLSAILTGFVSHICAATVDEYRSACDHADIQGCYQLGLAYARGEGVGQDIKIAKSYLSLSCDEGVDDACIALKSLGSVAVLNQNNTNFSNTELTSYHNDRFDFVLVYPATFFGKKVFSDNGDGIALYDQDESLELRAYGSYYGNTIGEVYRDELRWAKEEGRQVTYKVLRQDWFVISGFEDRGETIFYQKMYFKDGKSVGFRLKYPTKEKQKYNALVSIISQNFTYK